MITLLDDNKSYCLNIRGKIGIAWARKSHYRCRGFAVLYGGGMLWGEMVYLRIWRLIVGYKTHKQQPFFELYFPKNYILNER